MLTHQAQRILKAISLNLIHQTDLRFKLNLLNMDLINKVIRVESVESAPTKTGKQKLKVKDENNLTYQIWQLKQDGTETMAWQNFKPQALDAVGKTYNISFGESQGDFNGKAITYRSIVKIEHTDTAPQPMQSTPQPMQGGRTSSDGEVMKALREIYKLLSVINAKLGIEEEKDSKTPENANKKASAQYPDEPWKTDPKYQSKEMVAGKVKTDDAVFDAVVNAM